MNPTSRNFIIGFLVVLALAIYYENRETPEEKEQRIAKKQKEQLAKERADEVRELSLLGFTLSHSLTECLEEVKANGDIDVNIKTADSDFETVANFKTKLNNILVSCDVFAYRDTIALIQIKTNSFMCQDGIPSLYTTKYGEPSDGYSNSSDVKWVYKDNSIRIKKYYTTTTEKRLIADRANLKLNNHNNYYRDVTKTSFSHLVVTYRDYHYANKLEYARDRYKKEQDDLSAKEDLIRRHKQDSINRAKVVADSLRRVEKEAQFLDAI